MSALAIVKDEYARIDALFIFSEDFQGLKSMAAGVKFFCEILVSLRDDVPKMGVGVRK